MQYLLSPQDLAAVELVPELVQAGVGCFKIEGRLKGPEYVAATTSVYRRAVDAAWQALTGSSGGGGTDAVPAAAAAAAAAAEAGRLRLSGGEWAELQQVFAGGQDGAHGGLTPGFLEGSLHQRLVRGRNPRHRGNFLGTVQQVGGLGSGDKKGRWADRPGACCTPPGLLHSWPTPPPARALPRSHAAAWWCSCSSP